MALHGGLERHTARIAGRIADATGASLYRVTQPPDLAWHIPSTEHDPAVSPVLRRFLRHVSTVVSVHGFGRPSLRRTVLVGGRNRSFGREIAAALRRRTSLTVVDDLDAIPAGLRGRHPANPVNLPARAGVQLELSPSARVAPEVDGVVAAVSAVVRAGQASLLAGR